MVARVSQPRFASANAFTKPRSLSAGWEYIVCGGSSGGMPVACGSMGEKRSCRKMHRKRLLLWLTDRARSID
jgi:hypothetical protein